MSEGTDKDKYDEDDENDGDDEEGRGSVCFDICKISTESEKLQQPFSCRRCVWISLESPRLRGSSAGRAVGQIVGAIPPQTTSLKILKLPSTPALLVRDSSALFLPNLCRFKLVKMLPVSYVTFPKMAEIQVMLTDRNF